MIKFNTSYNISLINLIRHSTESIYSHYQT